MAVSTAARLRIDELAHRTGIASGTIRFYQRESLIPPPEREGRVAWYGEEHLRRLERVKALQAQGLPLAVIGDLLDREDRGEAVAGWIALDRAVFGDAAGPAEPVPAEELERLGLGGDDVDALVGSGAFFGAAGRLSAPPGMLELIRRLLEAGVEPRTIRAGAEVVAERVRETAESIADLGWEVFAAERESIESGDPVPEEVLHKLEELRALARQVVAVLFPRALDEAVRARTEAYAADVVERRRRG